MAAIPFSRNLEKDNDWSFWTILVNSVYVVASTQGALLSTALAEHEACLLWLVT